MTTPWWHYFAVREEAEYVLPPGERHFAFFVMLIAMLIITPQFIYSLMRLWSQTAYTGNDIVKNYSLMLIGVYFTILNSFLLRLSIYFTDGELSFLAQEKGILFISGILIYLTGLVHTAFNIINFRTRTTRIINFFYYLFVILALSVLITQILIILGNDDILLITLALQSIAVILGISFLIIFISSFLFEMTNDPSKIEKLRLKLLSIGVVMMVFEVLAIGLGSIAKRNNNPELFVYVSSYVVPITYLIAQPIMYLVFLWSVFTPNWLLIRAKIIQPSFGEFLKRKR